MLSIWMPNLLITKRHTPTLTAEEHCILIVPYETSYFEWIQAYKLSIQIKNQSKEHSWVLYAGIHPSPTLTMYASMKLHDKAREPFFPRQILTQCHNTAFTEHRNRESLTMSKYSPWYEKGRRNHLQTLIGSLFCTPAKAVQQFFRWACQPSRWMPLSFREKKKKPWKLSLPK